MRRLLILLAVLATAAPTPRIPGWFLAKGNDPAYQASVDEEVFHTGKRSATLRCTDSTGCSGFGTLMQTFRADEYRGKRIRLTAWVKAVRAGRASIWMRIDTREMQAAFDNMQERAIRGTSSDWRGQAIVLNVPKDAATINYGLLLVGNGQAWVDDFEFEVVDKKVKTTEMSEGNSRIDEPMSLERLALFPAAPLNPGFEQEK